MFFTYYPLRSKINLKKNKNICTGQIKYLTALVYFSKKFVLWKSQKVSTILKTVFFLHRTR